MARLVDHFPELLVGLSFYQCGVYLAFIFHSYNHVVSEWRSQTYFVWALLFAVLGGYLATMLLSLSRALAKRIVWLHYYLLAVGSALLLAAGLVLIISRDFHTATIIGGIGHGLVYISGMTYIHVRTKMHRHRIARIGLCHLAMAIGMVSSVHYMSYRSRMVWSFSEFGYFLAYSSGSTLGFFLLNEFLHGVGVYNYKKCLDPQLLAADQEKDRLRSALIAGLDNPRRGVKNKWKQWELTILAIFAKGLHGLALNNIFLVWTVYAESTMVRNGGYILHYFILAGIILTMIFSLTAKTRILYPMALICGIICLFIGSFFWNSGVYSIQTVFYWLFYLCVGAASIFPDAMLMEVARPACYEASLSAGFLLEQVPLVLTIVYVQFPRWITNFRINDFRATSGTYMVIAAVISVFVIIRYPNTFRLSLLDIQHLILYGAVRPPPATTIQSYPPNVVQPPPNNAQMHAVYPTPGYAPGLTHQQMTIIPVPQPGSSQGYFSTQPAYPGQQPLYPQQPMFMAPVQRQQQQPLNYMAGTHVPQIGVVEATETEPMPSAPTVSPNPRLEENPWNIQLPAYHSATTVN